MLHSRVAYFHQVEQPLLVCRLLWPVDLQGGGFSQALPQIYDLQVEMGGQGDGTCIHSFRFLQLGGEAAAPGSLPVLTLK